MGRNAWKEYLVENRRESWLGNIIQVVSLEWHPFTCSFLKQNYSTAFYLKYLNFISPLLFVNNCHLCFHRRIAVLPRHLWLPSDGSRCFSYFEHLPRHMGSPLCYTAWDLSSCKTTQEIIISMIAQIICTPKQYTTCVFHLCRPSLTAMISLPCTQSSATCLGCGTPNELWMHQENSILSYHLLIQNPCHFALNPFSKMLSIPVASQAALLASIWNHPADACYCVVLSGPGNHSSLVKASLVPVARLLFLL